MSTTTTLLADALLEHVSDREVAEVLFARVSRTRPMSMKTDLSNESALKHYKGDLNQAVTVASSTTSSEVLERFSKDPRISVRRTVAHNVHLGPKAASYLHRWGHQKEDAEILLGVLPKVPVSEALEALPTMTVSKRSYPWNALAEGVRRDGSVEAYRLARAANHPSLDVLLALDVYEGKVEGYTLEEFLSDMRPDQAAAALATVASSARTISADLATRLVSAAEDLALRLRGDSFCPQAREVEDDAIRVILDSTVEPLWVALAQCRISAPLIHKLLAKGSAKVAEELSSQRQRSLTSSMAEKAAVLMREGNSSSHLAGRFLRNVHVTLSSEAVLALLQLGEFETTLAWLSGELPHRPRAGEVAALVSDPGSAFGLRGYGYGYGRRRPASGEKMTPGDIAERLRYRLGPVLGKPWGRELVDSLGEHFLTLACSDHDVTAYLVKRLSSGLENRADLWEVVLTLSSGWTGGLSELIEMAYLSRGEVPPTPAPVPVVVKKRPVGEQMEIPVLED